MSEYLVRLRDIPDDIDAKLREIATREQKFLYDIYREALIEYAENHK